MRLGLYFGSQRMAARPSHERARACPTVLDLVYPSRTRGLLPVLTTENGRDDRVVRCEGVVFSPPVGRARLGSLRGLDRLGRRADGLALGGVPARSRARRSRSRWIRPGKGSRPQLPQRHRHGPHTPPAEWTFVDEDLLAAGGSARPRAPGSRTSRSGRTGLGWDRRPCTPAAAETSGDEAHGVPRSS